jgi:transcriptional regulator with XRE-family HTH domain
MDKSLNNDVARVARGLLAVREMQHKDLAEAMRTSTSNVSRWLKGGTFDTDTLECMADGLGIRVDQLTRLAVMSRRYNDGEMSSLLAAFDASDGRAPESDESQEGLTGS